MESIMDILATIAAIAILLSPFILVKGAVLGIVLIFMNTPRQKAKRAYTAMLRRAAMGTWNFPTEKLKSKCIELNQSDIFFKKHLDSAEFIHLQKIARLVMEEEGIPTMYHDMYLTEEAIEGYFAEVKDRDQQAKAAALQKERDEERKKEIKIHQEQLRYTHCDRHNKSLSYCSDQIKQYKEEITKLKAMEQQTMTGAQNVYQSMSQRERDWALEGGMGGVAQALDAQVNNIAIRQHNDALRHDIASMAAKSLTAIYEQRRIKESHLEYWMKEEERVKIRVTEEEQQDLLLSYLQPTCKSIKTSITNALKFEIKVMRPQDDILLYESINAFIDGSIRLEVVKNETVIGATEFALPYSGVDGDATIECICLMDEPVANYKVRFTPISLWLTER